MTRRISLAAACLLVAASCSLLPGESAQDSPVTIGGEAAGESSTSADGGDRPAPAVLAEVPVPEPDLTPIPIRDDVRTGVLDNGLRYYVKSNEAPGGSLSLRLVVDAGSLQQEEPESGSAHFLEHMLFNGTERFPGIEMRRALERLGVEFGADLNAYTSFDETVYQLGISSLTGDRVDEAYDVLAEWASAATIAPQDTIEERGVVREEIRLRDEGANRVVTSAFNELYLGGSAYAGREPGGRADLILQTEADDLQTFYERWYRPDLMAVVAVGDLPLDRLEQELVERFDSLEAPPDAPERVYPTPDLIDTPTVKVISHPELPRQFISIDYSIPVWDSSTVGGERLVMIQELYASMVANRLQDAVDRGEVELEQPFASRFSVTRRQSFLGFNYDANDPLAGSTYVLEEMQRLQISGFTEAEYQRVADDYRNDLDQYVAGAATIQDSALADELAQHYLTGAALSSPAELRDRLFSHLGSLTAAEISDVFRWDMSQSAPLVVVVGPEPDELPSVEELERAIANALAISDGNEVVDDGPAITELMARPDKVLPESRGTIDELNAVEWVFANGVTVRFIPSEIAKRQVDVVGISQGGWSALPAEEAMLASYAVNAVADRGYATHDRVPLRRFQSTTTAASAPFIDETTEGFTGTSGTADLETLFQQLHLWVTSPAVDDVALQNVRSASEQAVSQVENDSLSAGIEELAKTLYDDDPRFTTVPGSADELTADLAIGIYNERLGTVDDLVVAVVGDATEAEVVDLAARYLGSLPGGPSDSWVNVRPDPPSETVRQVTAGSGEAAGAVIIGYGVELDLSAERRVELAVLEHIVNGRLVDVVREELGASYGGRASFAPSSAPINAVDVRLWANVDPARGDEILAVLTGQLAEVAESGPTPEEFGRATSVLGQDYAFVSNSDLINWLLTPGGEDPLSFERRVALLNRVATTDIAKLARQVLASDEQVGVVVTPG